MPKKLIGLYRFKAKDYKENPNLLIDMMVKNQFNQITKPLEDNLI